MCAWMPDMAANSRAAFDQNLPDQSETILNVQLLGQGGCPSLRIVSASDFAYLLMQWKWCLSSLWPLSACIMSHIWPQNCFRVFCTWEEIRIQSGIGAAKSRVTWSHRMVAAVSFTVVWYDEWPLSAFKWPFCHWFCQHLSLRLHWQNNRLCRHGRLHMLYGDADNAWKVVFVRQQQHVAPVVRLTLCLHVNYRACNQKQLPQTYPMNSS